MNTRRPSSSQLDRSVIVRALAWLALSPVASSNGSASTVSNLNPPTSADADCESRETLGPPANRNETVILIHGLGRSRRSMSWLARQFKQAGYTVVNFGYPSTRLSVSEAAVHLRLRLAPHLGTNSMASAGRVHFVTHSLGGIVVRALLQDQRPPHLGRVVMLGPPNQGSEVADRLARNPAFRWAAGPAGQELGTGPSSTPNRLGPVDFEVGVIAGRSSLNPLFSSWLKGPDDGKVSVARTAVPGMRDLLVVARGHTFLMHSRKVAKQALQFIAHGRFLHPPPA